MYLDFRFSICQKIESCLPHSGVSTLFKYWIYKGNVCSFNFINLLLVPFQAFGSKNKQIFLLKIQYLQRCIEIVSYNKILNFNLNFSQHSMYWYFFLEFSWIISDRFFSLVHFPSFCKISDQTDKMPRNESKNKIIMVSTNTIPM